jgi:pilus assembly protein CpaB
MKSRRLLLVVAAVIATLGVAMVFVYAKSADARAAEQYDTVEVLIATKKIQPGESFDDALESGKIEKAEVIKAQLLSGAVDETDPFQDTVALTTIYPQEQLLPVKFGGAGEVEAAATLPIPKGKIAISILVTDDGRVGKFTGPGAEVAVIFTDLENNEPVLTKTLLERVTVLAAGTSTTIDSEEASEEGSNDEIQQLLTIAVSQQEAERVRFAEKDGELSAALLNEASAVASDEGVTKDNLLEPGE